MFGKYANIAFGKHAKVYPGPNEKAEEKQLEGIKERLQARREADELDRKKAQEENLINASKMLSRIKQNNDEYDDNYRYDENQTNKGVRTNTGVITKRGGRKHSTKKRKASRKKRASIKRFRK